MSASILFLDIDGVLNSEMWYRARTPAPWNEQREIDPEAFFLLRAVVLMSGCEVVISSSWRLGRTLDDLRRLLPGIPIIGMTPDLRTGKTRGAEVEQWLKENPQVTTYCCVDDGTDFYEHQPRVLTCWKVGLTPRLAEEIVTRLQARTGGSR